MTNRRWVAALGTLILGAAATACATLPRSGSVPLKTLQGSGSDAQHGVQIVPVAPGPGWSPADIVNGFLAASASFDGHKHAIAHEYLTPKFRRTWRPGSAATIIDAPKVVKARTLKGLNPQTGGPYTALVNLTGPHFATLQTAGQDQAGILVVSPGSTRYQFSLLQKRGGWRIDAIYYKSKPVNPSLLLLTSTDFARDYLPRNLYFYSPHPAAKSLVPDPVYMPQIGPVAEVTGLVNALIHPPPPGSWLWHAATTAFPRGTKLIGTQVIGGIQAVVDVGGAAARADRAQKQQMADQLALSLTFPPYATQIKSVVLRINNHRLNPPPAKYAALVARGATSPLYYQVAGAAEPAVAALRPNSPTPVPLPIPAGLAHQPFTTVAVSTGTAPTIAGCAGRSLYLIKLAAGVLAGKKPSAAGGPPAVRKSLPMQCTALSWDDRGNLWVAAETQTLMLPAAGSAAMAKTALVPVSALPWLPPNAAITTMRVAPDGVRVAMIVGSGPGKRILVAAISRNGSITYIGQTQQMLRVGSDIANPFTLTWLDPDHLLVLSKSSAGRTQMFQVPLNGGDSTEITSPRRVTSVAANWPNWPNGQPRVVISIAPTPSSPGNMEISKSGMLNPDWQPLAKGTTPVFPG